MPRLNLGIFFHERVEAIVVSAAQVDGNTLAPRQRLDKKDERGNRDEPGAYKAPGFGIRFLGAILRCRFSLPANCGRKRSSPHFCRQS
jgi:hypothetical protein